MYKLRMEVSNPYDIYIENDLLSKVDNYLKEIYHNKNIYVVSDERVSKFYLNKLKNALPSFDVKEVIIEGYEKSKSLETYAYVCESLINLGITRDELLIALGGGVIGDLVGFVAGTLYRGLPYVQIPTSLLSQVDSSIGGKTGIDFLNHKNILGVFKQPSLVLIDPLTLKTLPEKELKNGFGEMIKHALIGSPKLFSLLESGLEVNEEVIYENLLVKQKCVTLDEFDKGERMKLNYGHTFGHIIELEQNLLHGEAVLSGILCILDYTYDLGLIEDLSLKERVLKLYEKYQLNYLLIDYHSLISRLHFDKKNLAGVINFIIVKKLGEAEILKVSEECLCK